MNNGLEGLGAINAAIGEGTLNEGLARMSQGDVSGAAAVTNERMLAADPAAFGSAEAFSPYLRDWFVRTDLFELMENATLSSIVYVPGIFDVHYKDGSDPQSYTIIPAFDIQTATDVIQRVREMGSLPNKAVIFAFHNFTKNDLDIARALNIELIGYQDIYDINNALASMFGGLTMTNTFSTKLQKALNSRYAPSMNNMGQSAGTSLNDLGSGLVNSFSEAFVDLKQSVTGALGSIGIKLNGNAPAQQPTALPTGQPVVDVNCIPANPAPAPAAPIGAAPVFGAAAVAAAGSTKGITGLGGSLIEDNVLNGDVVSGKIIDTAATVVPEPAAPTPAEVIAATVIEAPAAPVVLAKEEAPAEAPAEDTDDGKVKLTKD